MQEDALHKSARFILPRWRSIGRTQSIELPTSRKSTRAIVSVSLPVKNAIERFEKVQTLADASDIIDGAIRNGNYVLAVPAALHVVGEERAVRGLHQAAMQVLGRSSDRPPS